MPDMELRDKLNQLYDKVVNNGNDQRESVRWIAAFEEHLSAGFIRQADTTGQVYQVTDAGYKYRDENWVVQVL